MNMEISCNRLTDGHDEFPRNHPRATRIERDFLKRIISIE